MSGETVAHETDGLVGTITLNRPTKMNAFNAQLLPATWHRERVAQLILPI